MKSLQQIKEEYVEKELRTAEKIEDDGIDKEEKKQIENDSKEHQRIAKEKQRMKEENAKSE